MQVALDAYMESYNQHRPHQGRGMNGGTPATAFLEGLLNQPHSKEVKKPEKRETGRLTPTHRGTVSRLPSLYTLYNNSARVQTIYSLTVFEPNCSQCRSFNLPKTS